MLRTGLIVCVVPNVWYILLGHVIYKTIHDKNWFPLIWLKYVTKCHTIALLKQHKLSIK
jgi:hypothetical protein